MQERVNEKTVGIAVQATKMTARILARVTSAYVHHVKEKRHEKAVDKRNDQARYKQNQAGKVKIKTLMKEGEGISNVEIKDDNIRIFERLARKNGIRYAIKKDRSTQPPTFYIFFKGKNAEVIEATLREFTKREKKLMIPTDDGVKLITVLPDVVKSPKLTADWENTLTLVAKGQYSAEQFMKGIREMVSDLIKTYHEVGEENKNMFGSSDALGKCPKCGGDVVMGKFGPYCSEKCGMSLGKVFGKELTEAQVKDLLEGKKILVDGLKSKNGGTYSAYLTPDGIQEYSYTKKDGTTVNGFRYKFNMEFPGKEG